MSLAISFACVCCKRTDTMNITHNLRPMAREAGIAGLWDISTDDPHSMRPKFWIPRLETALEVMRNRPERFEKHNSPNGWGTFVEFVPWVEELLRRCQDSPGDVMSVHG